MQIWMSPLLPGIVLPESVRSHGRVDDYLRKRRDLRKSKNHHLLRMNRLAILYLHFLDIYSKLF